MELKPPHETKILITDDGPINIVLLQSLLEAFEYQTAEAIDGYDCIYKTLSWSPDLILLDIEMPGMDGIEACKFIKSLSFGKQIPIIFISGTLDPLARYRCLEAGGSAFFAKPFDIEELIEQVEKCLAEPIPIESKHHGFNQVYCQPLNMSTVTNSSHPFPDGI